MALGSSDKDTSGKFWMNLQPHFKKTKGLIQKHKTISIVCFVLLIFVIFIILPAQIKPAKKIAKNQLPSVVLAQAQSRDVPVFLNELGAVTPIDTITVVTQINGLLTNVYFKEGQTVKKGDLLAQIDPRPYEALLMQYEGQLLRDKALLANAKLDLARYITLWTQDSISKQTLDTQRALVQQYEGTVENDEGLVKAAKLDLLYCKITSPVNGRVGLRLVDPGNFVQTTETTGLFVLNTVQPITVIFTVAEDDIPQVLKHFSEKQPLEVQAYNRSQNKLLETGKLYAIDNQIDPTTGTVKLKAEFKNKNNVLFPNQFVNVRLKIDTLKDAITIPTAAIQYGTKKYVYVYDPAHQTVHLTSIESSITFGDNTVITSGIKAGQSIVIEGTDKLTNGAKVKVFNHAHSDVNKVANKAVLKHGAS